MTERPWTLAWASSLVLLQTSFEVAYVVGRGDITPGLRVTLAGVLALQLLFARGAMRMSAGSVLALMAYEVMAVVAAIGGDGAFGVRGALAVSAVVVLVLLMVAIAAFPSPDLPKIT
ncbi:MAG: hypothetical protein QOD92_1697 [Acidimicrobiaceae bacterium]